jgi:hypothetical protein
MILDDRILWSSMFFGGTITIETDESSLIFLGSKEYPYKGVLDQLANRAGSNGTNAWTANDRQFCCRMPTSHKQLIRRLDTAYTISTAGSEGFLKMLPSKLNSLKSRNSSLTALQSMSTIFYTPR